MGFHFLILNSKKIVETLNRLSWKSVDSQLTKKMTKFKSIKETQR
jgi:hypothetical protein